MYTLYRLYRPSSSALAVLEYATRKTVFPANRIEYEVVRFSDPGIDLTV
jgi:hypothetical protein